MKNIIIDDLLLKILNYIDIKTKIKYIPINNDGEQYRSIFYKDVMPYCLVCKKWHNYFNYNIKNDFNNFFNLF